MVYGSTRVGHDIHSASTGAFSADEATEERLVSLGVAVRVGAPDHAQTLPRNDSAAGEEPENAGEVSTPPAAENASQGDEEAAGGHLDPDQLRTMTNAALKKLAEDMGLDASKCRNKEQYVALLTSVEIDIEDTEDPEAADDDEPPDLNAEAPIV